MNSFCLCLVIQMMFMLISINGSCSDITAGLFYRPQLANTTSLTLPYCFEEI